MQTNGPKLPRGLNNNNPGNIEKTKPGKPKWNGEIESTDPRFAQFVEIEYGYRAMFKLLQRYITKLNKDTIKEMISTWAPPTNDKGEHENHTDSYIATVCKQSGIGQDEVIDYKDKDKLVKIVAAMSLVENGRKAHIEDVEKGWELYVNSL